MLLSRISDTREQRLLRQGHGWFHVAAMGHEALAGVGLLMQSHDYLAGYYRDRPIALARGVSLNELASAFHATSASSSGGRQMPSHFSNRSLGILSPSSSIASSLLPGCGLAWGLKLDGRPGLVVATVGDAGTRQGDFYEAITLACDWQLPILFLVEDNGLGISTPTAKSNPLHLAILNQSLWRVIDGCDAECVYREAASAMAAIRQGHGPRFLWLKLERLSDHTSTDQQNLYRSLHDLRRLEERDPLDLFRRRLIALGELDQESFDRLEVSVSDAVRLAYDSAFHIEQPSRDAVDGDTSSTEPPSLPIEAGDWPAELHMADAVNRILAVCLEVSSDTVLLGEDIEDPLGGVFRLTRGLSSRYPERVKNAPLAESTIIGTAVGLAAYGKRPIFELQFIDYIFPGLQHVANHLTSLDWRSQGDWTVPAVFYAPCGAYLPAGGMWHSQSLASLLAQFPHLQIAIPSTPEDAVGLFWTALHSRQPSFILLPKHLLWKPSPFPARPQPVPFGTARLCRQGNDLTIVTWGNGLELVGNALQALSLQHSIELIDLRSVAPIDLQTVLCSVLKTRRLMVVQEELEACSVGQSVVSMVVGALPVNHLHCPPRLLSRLDLPIGFHPDLEDQVLPSSADVTAAITQLLGSIPQQSAPSEPVIAADAPVQVTVPVLGEGLAEAKVLTLLCTAGSVVQRDQVIAELETDKAILQVESPADGQLARWHVEAGRRVDLHGVLATIIPASRSSEETSLQKPIQTSQSASLPNKNHLRGPGGLNWSSLPSIRRVVPAAAQRILPWPSSASDVPKARRMTLTAMVAWGMAKAMASTSLREELPRDLQSSAEQLRAAGGLQDVLESDQADLLQAVALATSPSPDLGIAVSDRDGVLRTAVMRDVLNVDVSEFHSAYRQAVKETLSGARQPLSKTAWIVSSLGPHGPSAAIPLVVPPAFGTLFLHAANGELSLWLSFDHRWITGACADRVLRQVGDALSAFRTDNG